MLLRLWSGGDSRREGRDASLGEEFEVSPEGILYKVGSFKYNKLNSLTENSLFSEWIGKFFLVLPTQIPVFPEKKQTKLKKWVY